MENEIRTLTSYQEQYVVVLKRAYVCLMMLMMILLINKHIIQHTKLFAVIQSSHSVFITWTKKKIKWNVQQKRENLYMARQTVRRIVIVDSRLRFIILFGPIKENKKRNEIKWMNEWMNKCDRGSEKCREKELFKKYLCAFYLLVPIIICMWYLYV